MATVSIVSGYCFVALADGAALRERLFARARSAALKGTVLIAPEGINLSLAGPCDAVEGWLDALRADARFGSMSFKHHSAERVPFKRLRVKLKREIIRMNEDGVRPEDGRAATVDAATLARWLAQGRCDEGRPLLMLDTRNGFEVDAGAFEGAADWRLRSFSDFPGALQAHRAELLGKTVVSYCTGGIRCEKAALWMQQAGVAHVKQLEGGILRYFEAVPGAPSWQGRCFVFDERVALDSALQGHSA